MCPRAAAGHEQTAEQTAIGLHAFDVRDRGSAAVSVTRAAFPDGTLVELSVAAPWWSWLWLGLVYQPGQASVSASAPLTNITIRALGLAVTSPNLAQVVDLGHQECNACSSLTMLVHNFGFPFPPWLGGGGFRGIGYNVTAARGGRSVVLHDHWGSTGDTTVTGIGLPDGFT